MTTLINLRILAQDTLRNVDAFGGSTLSAQAGVITASSGYIVSLPGHEQTFAADIERDKLTKAVEQYADSKRAELAVPGRYLGAWTDNGTLYLDVSEVHAELATAVKLGWQRNQLAIYDIAKDREIRTRPGRRTTITPEQITADKIAHETGLVSDWFKALGTVHGEIMSAALHPHNADIFDFGAAAEPSPFETVASGVYDVEKDTLKISPVE